VTEDIWRKAVDLTKKVFAATPSITVRAGDRWQIVVAVQLYEARERLDSIGMILGKGHRDSGEVLVRSLFEIAVNLAYVAKNVEERLSEYLRHGGFPVSEEDADELLRKLSNESLAEMKEVVPERAWKSLRAMCCDLGWLGEYGTFYRYLSVVGHAGSFRLMSNALRLLGKEPGSQWERASVLVSSCG
jgi:hypothetical protein